MSESFLVAVPSNAPGGLQASPSEHFGHCDMYTIASVNGKNINNVITHLNSGHDHGSCLQPVLELANQGVKVLIAGGMGMNPLRGLQEAGVEVYFATGMPTVGDILEAFAAGKLKPFGENNLCQGGCSNH